MLSGVMLSVVMLSVVASLRTKRCCFHGKFRGRLVEQKSRRANKIFSGRDGAPPCGSAPEVGVLNNQARPK